MSAPLLSILMPVYNVSPFLEQSLGSLLCQTLREIEIICVDDGSTDRSLEILESYAQRDNRIRIIHKSNSGYGNTMNRALASATGEYIGILEPDDFADPDMFEKLYTVATNTQAEIVKSNYWAFRTDDQSNTFTEPLWEKQYDTVLSARENPRIVIGPACIWSAIYLRSFLARHHIRFTETPGASYQDTSFGFKALACAEHVVFVRDAYLHYRVDNESSSVNSMGKIFSICDEFQSIQDFLNEDADRRKRFSGVLQVHKLRVYGWNLRRIAPEYKDLFQMQMALDFIKADYDGFLKEEDFSPEEWNRVRQYMDCYYHSREQRQLDSVRSSVSYRLGRALTLGPRKIRDALKGGGTR